MKVPLRETGSILVNAPRDRVFELLRRRMADSPGLRETPSERLDSGRPGEAATFVLRDAPGGTRVIHARSQPGAFLATAEPRHELRAAVEAELLQLQRLLHEGS